MFQRFRRLKNKTFEAGVDGADSHLSRNHGGEGGTPDLVAGPYFQNSNLEGGGPSAEGRFISRAESPGWEDSLEKQGLTGFWGARFSGRNRGGFRNAAGRVDHLLCEMFADSSGRICRQSGIAAT